MENINTDFREMRVFVRGKNIKDEVSTSSFLLYIQLEFLTFSAVIKNEYRRQNNRLKIQNSSVGRLEGN